MRYTLLLSIFLLFACTGKKTTEENAAPENKGPQVINLEEAISQPSETVPLSEAVRELRIVPLETTAESLVGNVQSIQIMGDDIFVLDLQSGILRFSKDGKFLNKIGTRGQGPGEYVWPKGLLTNEKAGLIGIQESTDQADMVKWYSLDGKFVREQPAEKQRMFLGMNGYFFNYQDKFMAVDKLAFLVGNIEGNKNHTKYWSLALLDSAFNVQKEYMNPDFIRNEQDIRDNIFSGRMENHYAEEGPFISVFGDKLNVLYYQGDTIYRYQDTTQDFAPEYILNVGSKASFAESHRFYNKEQSFFNLLCVHALYQTEKYLYFQATRSSNGYTMVLRVYTDRILYLQNDLVGGDFSVDYASSGKYWISILDSDKLEDFEATSPELLSILEKRKVDDNPILLIGVL